ncbi:MAG: YidB family protein [Xanthobacteraceae bacterium]
MDILNGMQNGPRGQQRPAPAGSSSGGMSPMMMALLGLLAYKAIKGGGLSNMLGGGSSPSPAPAGRPSDPRATTEASSGGLGDILGGMLGGGAPAGRSPDPRETRADASSGGGLGDLLGGLMGNTQAMPGGLGGMLGGLLGGAAGGAAAGGALNGGLRHLLNDMEENGQGDAARSWVSNGPNQSLPPRDLAQAIGADDIDAVSQQTGVPRDQMLAMLSEHLPDLVNQLTPNGRLPTEHEASRW